MRFFASGFFHESPSPKSLKKTLGSFQFFSKILGDIGGKLATGINDTACVVDTGGKFATGVNDAGGKLLLVSTTPAANNGNNIRLQIP